VDDHLAFPPLDLRSAPGVGLHAHMAIAILMHRSVGLGNAAVCSKEQLLHMADVVNLDNVLRGSAFTREQIAEALQYVYRHNPRKKIPLEYYVDNEVKQPFVRVTVGILDSLCVAERSLAKRCFPREGKAIIYKPLRRSMRLVSELLARSQLSKEEVDLLAARLCDLEPTLPSDSPGHLWLQDVLAHHTHHP